MTATTTFTRYLTTDEERRLLKACAEAGTIWARRDAAWIRLVLHTGIRVGALCGLTVGDAQNALREGRLILRPAVQKRQQGHEVPLNQTAREALQTLLSLRREAGLGRIDVTDDALLFSQRGPSTSTRLLNYRLKMWGAAAGLPPAFSPHWLRHTTAKRLIANSTAKEPLGIVQSVLGHRSLASTGVYTRPDKEAVAAALQEISPQRSRRA